MEFKKILIKFTNDIGALREFIVLQKKYDTDSVKLIKKNPIAVIPNAIFYLQQKIESKIVTGNELKQMKKRLSDLKKESKRYFSYKIEDNKIVQIVPKHFTISKNISKTLRSMELNSIGKSFVIKSTLINLLCIFEKLFKDLFIFRVTENPSSIKISDQSITFKELVQISNVEDAMSLLLSNYIEKIFRDKNKEEWFFELERVYDFKIDFLSSLKEEFKEIVERRNLFVHNDGLVNNQYLKNVPNNLIKKFKVKKGEKIETDIDYLMSSIDIIEVIGVCTIIKAWKKTEERDKNRVSFINSNIVFQRLLEKKYFVSERIANFIMNDKNSREIDRDIAKINYWLSIKNQGFYDKIKSDVENFDYSAKDSQIQLGMMAIKDDRKSFFPLLNKMIKNKDFDLESYFTFPIFEKIRKTRESYKMFPRKVAKSK